MWSFLFVQFSRCTFQTSYSAQQNIDSVIRVLLLHGKKPRLLEQTRMISGFRKKSQAVDFAVRFVLPAVRPSLKIPAAARRAGSAKLWTGIKGYWETVSLGHAFVKSHLNGYIPLFIPPLLKTQLSRWTSVSEKGFGENCSLRIQQFSRLSLLVADY